MQTVLVSGAIANKCRYGGETWVRLNWILGMRKLGFRVFFVEEIDRETCVDATGAVTAFDTSVNLAYFKSVEEQFGLRGSAALICKNSEQCYGLGRDDLVDLGGRADLLLNISGHLSWPPLFDRFRLKVFIDIDPGYTQFWQASGNPGARLAGHDFFFTIGENIGSSSCPIPTDGIQWRHTRPPVVLDQWPAVPSQTLDRFTTVSSWRGGYGRIDHGGTLFGLKAHEFRKVMDLPRKTGERFEIALAIHPADQKDQELLRQHNWHLVDPLIETGSPETYRRYVQSSGAEFSASQGIYVETQSGWFSDRTALYLASGKPALVQDTGFSRHYPVGLGLVAFSTPDEAVEGARSIARDYPGHCRAARAIAERYFDSDRVLRSLLDEIGISP